ncbi:MAG: hypothetical protein ACXAC5_03530 [Promethearchaeota archaeon]|jgi:hypothetical protein
MATKLERVKERLIDNLVLLGELRLSEKVKHVAAGHGSCCTCQTCGYTYDECVCSHNELLDAVEEAFDLSK